MTQKILKLCMLPIGNPLLIKLLLVLERLQNGRCWTWCFFNELWRLSNLVYMIFMGITLMTNSKTKFNGLRRGYMGNRLLVTNYPFMMTFWDIVNALLVRQNSLRLEPILSPIEYQYCLKVRKKRTWPHQNPDDISRCFHEEIRSLFYIAQHLRFPCHRSLWVCTKS